MSPSETSPIAVILCSTRKPRVCPQIAAFVTQIIKTTRPTDEEAPHNLQLVDLAEWNLPMFDEPTIPSQIKDYKNYVQPHTRAWSQEIQKYSGFIFILPQYNWGYPAVIKNAIDYLFNEWHDKPALIISYGGHGGTKSAGQFRQVLQGVDMRIAETMPALSFPSRKALVQAAKGEDMGLLERGSEEKIWGSEEKAISQGFEELVALISQKKD